jgi:serine/threonine-protein kinase RsbW
VVAPLDDTSSIIGDVIELRIPSSAAYVTVARHTVEGVARRMPFERAEVEDVKLAVGEACNNAIKHGANGAKSAPVTIRCVVNHCSLEIEVHNYHIATAPCPDIDCTPDHSREGGLGFHMMRQLVDQVEFVWGEDFALVRLVKTVREVDG